MLKNINSCFDLLWEYKSEGNMKSTIGHLPDEWCLDIVLNIVGSSSEGYILELGSDIAPSLIVKYIDSGIMCELFTDAKTEPMNLHVPKLMVEKIGEHHLLLCCQKHRVSLYFDSELIDEEWPLGIFRSIDRLISIMDKEVLYVAIHNSLQLEVNIKQQQKTALLTSPFQYWTPPGYNTRVGDCMPFFHDGRFHLYYLLDRRGHKSKWGLGAHEWAHISTVDLITWEIHPIAIPITQQWEGSICTGSVFHNKGIFYAFYAARMSNQSPARLTYAKSNDGINFQKVDKYIYLKEPYEPVSARDPMVFEDGEGLFHMLVTTELIKPEFEGRGGCLAHLISKDLENWEQLEPFIIPGYTDQPECSDYFYMNGWYYLIFSNFGVAKYRMSRHPFGPWIKPDVDVIDGYMYRVPKTAAFGNNRRLAVGFLAKSKDEYAGCAIFREILQNSDGTLATSFPNELMPECKSFQNTDDSKSVNNFQSDIYVDGESGYKVIDLPALATNMKISFKVTPQSTSMYYGIVLKAVPECKKTGYMVLFDTSRLKVSTRRLDEPFLNENEWLSLYNVTGLDKTAEVELIINDDILDICINGRRTIVMRIQDISEGVTGLGLFSMCGNTSFEKICIEEISL